MLPRGVRSEFEVLPKPVDCKTLLKKYQHTCLKSKGRHGPGRGLNP